MIFKFRSFSNKILLRSIYFSILVVIITLQVNKRSQELANREYIKDQIRKAQTEYGKLLTQRSVYRDSVYKVYIANIKHEKQLIFLKADELSNLRKESRFFVHLYPNDSSLLKDNVDHIALDFNNNAQKFEVAGKQYFASYTILPEIGIKKLNLGQYGYRGNNEINWR